MSFGSGSNYPPGFNGNFPWDEPFICEVCGLSDDECICPECPVCGDFGDIRCYQKHGLEFTHRQKVCLEHREYIELTDAIETEKLYQYELAAWKDYEEEMYQRAEMDYEYATWLNEGSR